MKLVKMLFVQALIIATAILFGLGIQALISYIVNHQTRISCAWYTPLSIIIGGFLCALPSLILVSLEEVSGKKMWIRIIIHCISVWAVITVIGYLFNWYDTLEEYGIIMVMYVIIYNFVWIAESWMYAKEDKEINEYVKNIRDEE